MGRRRKPKTPGIELRPFQEEVAKEMQDRYPDRSDYETGLDLPFYRMVSTAGNLSALVAALADGVLFDPVQDSKVDPDVCREELREGLGKLVIWCTEFAARNGWSINAIVYEIWEIMKEEKDGA